VRRAARIDSIHRVRLSRIKFDLVAGADHSRIEPAKETTMTTGRSSALTLAFFALLQPWLALAQQAQPPGAAPPWDCTGPWHMWHGGWAFWWIFPLLMFLFIVACIVIFLLGHRSGTHPHWGPWQMIDRSAGPGRSWGDPTHSALEILNTRFAKGELQKQEYEEKKAAILSRP
jgi:uncharacterized membrane protein